jgi:hypothetical protein
MRARLVLLLVAAGFGALPLAGALLTRRERARHLAVPVLSDPSLPLALPTELLRGDPCDVREVARVGARVTALLRVEDDALLVGTFDAGLHRLSTGGDEARESGTEIVEIPDLRGRERFVNALVAHDGLAWVATQGGLLGFDGDRRAVSLLAGEGVTALVRARGALYAGTARGLHRVSAAGGAEPVPVTGPFGEPLRVTALATSGTSLWIGTASGVYSLPLATLEAALLARTARWHPLVFGDAPAETNVVTALAPLGDGVLAGTDDGGVVRVSGDGVTAATRFATARANEVNPGAAAVLEDGSVVVGTQGAGVLALRADGAAFRAETLGGAERAEVSALQVGEGRILAGTSQGAVLELRCPEAGRGEGVPHVQRSTIGRTRRARRRRWARPSTRG